MKGQHKEEEKKQNSRAVKNDKQGTFWLFEEVESLQALNQSVIKMVNKIRGEFGRSCLIVEQGNWTVDMRLALWSKANVLFVSTLKDGLYLTCFEYIHVKYLCKDFENSAMILSEFTGCSTQFAGFYDFNPFQVKTTVAALEKCLKDSPQEKAERMKRAFQFCHPRTFRSWVENFLKELKLACDPHTVEFTRIMYQGLQAVQYGKASRDIDCKLNFEAPLLPVQMDIKRQALVSVSRRKNLIMIDHEALPLKQLGRSEMFPRQQIILWIQEILYDKSNIVVIMSDKDRNYISSVFEQTLMQQENFWVAAESGYWLMTNKKQWIKLFEIQSKQWMHRIRSIMEEYCENIEGTLVEERSCTVIWNYKNAEEEYGSKSANILAEQIQHMLGQNSPIEIVRGNGFIEVLPKKLTKKAVLKHILSNLQLYCNQQIESFLFIGAEISDDSHQYLRNFIDKNIQQSGSQIRLAVDSRNRPLFAADCDYALCVLGNRPSIAQFYLEQRDVQYLLQEMAFKTQSRKRTKSVANLLDKSKNFESQENLYDSEEKELTQKISPKGLLTPPKKNLLKGRNLSQKNILRPISMPTRWMPPGIADHLENETIIETNEEDDTTQMSEFKQAEQDAHGISADLNDGNFNLRHNSEASLNYMRERISDNLGVGFRDLPKEFSRERKISGHAFDPSYQHSRTLFLNQQMEPRRHGTSSLQSFNEYEPNSSDLVVHQQVKLAEVSQTHESTSMPQLYRRSKKEVSPLTGNSELKMNDQMNLSSEDLAQHSKSSSFLNSGERWSESLPEEMFNKQDYSKSNSIFKERQSFFEYDQPDTPRLTPSDKKMKD